MGIVGLLFVAVALILIATLLYRAPKDGIKSQDKPTTRANRGDFYNVTVGTDLQGYMCGWAGDRVSSGGGGGGKGGGGAPSAATTTESAWHQIGLGPATKLHAIKESGKVIWSGPIESRNVPSGTSFEVPGHGSFKVYWGEIDQPINTFLADPARIGIASRWPYLFYIEWTNKVIATGGTWEPIEYVYSCDCLGSNLVDSNHVLEDENSTGVNGAHALLMWLNGIFPHGCGLEVTEIDDTTLEELGVLAELEHLPINMTLQPGTTYEAAVQSILTDYGVMLVQIDGRLAFLPMREPVADVPVLDDDVLAPQDLEREINRIEDPTSRMVFTFRDGKAFKYRDKDIAIDSDANASIAGTFTSEAILIATATDRYTASKIARRRSQEASVIGSIGVEALRGARQLSPGQMFDRVGVGRFRIMTKKRDDETAVVKFECALDSYSVPDIEDLDEEGIDSSSSSLGADEDIAFTFFELPDGSGTVPAIIVFRVRAHSQIAGAQVFVSADDSTYALAGNQDYASIGGILEEAVSASTADIITVGPIFEAQNFDGANALDLSSDSPSWQAGRFVCVINDEIFYAQYILLIDHDLWAATTAYIVGDYVVPAGTPTNLRYKCVDAGTSDSDEPTWPTTIEVGETVIDGGVVWEAHYFAYQINNMIRARDGSVAAAHGIGDQVYLADRSLLTVFTHAVIDVGNTVWLKTVPFTNAEIVDIALVDGVFKDIIGNVYPDVEFRYTQNDRYRITQTGERRITVA